MQQNLQPIGEFIKAIDNRNSDGGITNLMGISIDKCYIPSVANVIGTDLTNYKVIRKGQFACSLMQVSRDQRIPIAMYSFDEPAIMSPAYAMFEVTRLDLILPEYMELWFKRTEFDREASFYAVGGVRGSLDWKDFIKMRLPVPSIEEQRKIVQDYQVINERIDLVKKISGCLENVIQANFENIYSQAVVDINEAVTKNIDLPEGWKVTEIGEECSVQTGPFGSQLHNEDYSDEGTPIITVEHLKGKYINHLNLPLVNDDDYSRLIKYDLHVGDIVFSRVGSVDRATIVSPYENGWLFSGRCLRVRPNISSSDVYLLWWFNQPVVRRLIVSSAVGTTMPSINTSILSEIKYVLPPGNLLSDFCSNSRVLLSKIWDNNAEIRSLEAIRDGIFSLLCKGA